MIPRVRTEDEKIAEFYEEQFTRAKTDIEYRPVPAYMRNPEDWAYGVRHMNQFQQIWYTNLIDEAWTLSHASGPQGTLPNDIDKLRQLARIKDLERCLNDLGTDFERRSVCFAKLLEEVLENFVPVPNHPELLHNKRLTKELRKALDKSNAARIGGLVSGEVRRKSKENKGDGTTFERIGNERGTTFERIANEQRTKSNNININKDQDHTILATLGSSLSSFSDDQDLGTEGSGVEAADKKSRLVASEVRELFDYWRVKLKPKAVLDKKRRATLVRAFALGKTLDELKAAVDGCCLSEWHQGQNDRGVKYNDISNIFCDANHIETFIELFERSKNGQRKIKRSLEAYGEELEREIEREREEARIEQDSGESTSDFPPLSL